MPNFILICRVSRKTGNTFVFKISRLPMDLKISSWTFFNSPFHVDFKNIPDFIIWLKVDQDIVKILQGTLLKSWHFWFSTGLSTWVLWITHQHSWLSWELMSTHEHSWVLMSSHEHSWAFRSTSELSWPLISTQEHSWVWCHGNRSVHECYRCHVIMPMNVHEYPWVLIAALGWSWVAMSRVLIAAFEYSWVFMNANECSCVLLISHECF